MNPYISVLLIISSVAIIFLSVAAMELIFQRRLIEILDRFLSRNLGDLVGSQYAVGKREPIEQSLDLQDQMDLDAIREVSTALHTPLRPGITEDD